MNTKKRPNRRDIMLSGTGKRQRGAVLALLTIAMVAMLGIVGLALDGGHSTLSLTRLQNTLDASALSAAKTLNQTKGDTVLAEVEALSMFSDNAGNAGNSEIQNAYSNGEIQVSVQFSSSLDPFVPGTVPAQYVRVSANNFQLQGWFIPILGINEIEVTTTAVAGPSPALSKVCHVVPLMVCGDPGAGAPYYGFTPGMPTMLKASNPADGGTPGPGNFLAIRLEDQQGGNDFRHALAGSYGNCVNQGESIETEPGNMVGPSAGINTRLGIYKGSLKNSQAEYPPDVVTTSVEPPLELGEDGETIMYDGQPINSLNDITYYSYAQYSAQVAAQQYTYAPLDGEPPGIGAFYRRTLAIPLGDCTNAGGGQQSIPLLNVLCYHLLQPMPSPGGGGGGGQEARIFGEFVGGDSCQVTGNPGDTPNNGPGPIVIQLYKDPDTVAS